MLGHASVQIPIKPSYSQRVCRLSSNRGMVLQALSFSHLRDVHETAAQMGNQDCKVEISLKGGPAERIPSASTIFDDL